MQNQVPGDIPGYAAILAPPHPRMLLRVEEQGALELLRRSAHDSGLPIIESSGRHEGGGIYHLWLPALHWSSAQARLLEMEPFRAALAPLLPGAKATFPSDGEYADEVLGRYHLYEGLLRLIDFQSQQTNGCLLIFTDVLQADPASLDLLIYCLQTRARSLCLILSGLTQTGCDPNRRAAILDLLDDRPVLGTEISDTTPQAPRPLSESETLNAARLAQSCFAFESAELHIRNLLALPHPPAPVAQLTEMWGDSLYGLGRGELAIEKYSAVLEMECSLSDRVRLLRKIGTCWEQCGRMLESQERLQEALSLLGLELVHYDEDEGPPGLARTLSIFSRNFLAAAPALDEPWRAGEIYAVCERLMRVLYIIRPTAWIRDFLNLLLIQFKLAWTDRAHNPNRKDQSVAQAFLLGGYFSLRGLGWNQLARQSLIYAADAAHELKDGPRKSSVLRDTGYILLLSGSPGRARVLLEEARELSIRVGDHGGLARNHLQLGSLCNYLGYVDQAQQQAEEALTWARRAGSHADQTIAVSDIATSQAIRGLVSEARANLTVAEEMRTRCRSTYIDLLFGRAHCYVAFFEGELETSQQVADHLFLHHSENGELPFHLVNFGILSLAAQAERFRKGGSFDRKAFTEKLKGLRKMSQGYSVYLKMLDRLEAQTLFYAGKRARALEQLAICAYWADRENHPLEAARTHLCLAQILDFEGLGDHHRRQAGREFERAGVVAVYS